MRLPFSDKIERGRLTPRPQFESARGDDYGYFALRRRGTDPILIVIASSGREADGTVNPEIPWEHVSVSTRQRCPTWDEMCWVKDLFFHEEEAVVQFHPPRSAYVNHHPYCLHLWRPLAYSLQLPPTVAVGPDDALKGSSAEACDP